MTKLNIAIITLLLLAVGSPHAGCGEGPEVWLVHPNIIELAGDESQWEYVSKNVDVIGLYVDNIPTYSPESLAKLVRILKKNHIKVAIECGGTLEYAPLDDTNGEESAKIELAKINNLLDAGMSPTYFDMDGPVKRLLHPGGDKIGFINIEDCVDELVDYMRAVRARLPDVQFFDITNLPNWGWKGMPSYWGLGPKRQFWGDFSRVVPVLIRKTKSAGIPLKGLTVDNPYDFVICAAQSANKDVSKIDWMGRILELERYVERQGLEFNLIFNSQRGGDSSDKLYFEDTLKYIDEYRARGGSPKRYIIESWYTHPTRVVPETEPYTMTALAKAAIQKIRAKLRQ